MKHNEIHVENGSVAFQLLIDTYVETKRPVSQAPPFNQLYAASRHFFILFSSSVPGRS